VSFFKHCLPGSSQHMKVLKKTPYGFVRPDQVKQLVTSISVKGNLVPEVAEEVVCLGLKGENSLSLYQEVNIKYCDLFSAVYNQDRRIGILRLDYATKQQVPATTGGFSQQRTSGYYPDWARLQDVSKYCKNHVRMSSESNLKFNIDRTTPSQIKALERETVHFECPDVDFSAVQGLLHSSKYLFLSDPIGELAKYLQLSRHELIDNIEVLPKGEGYLPFLRSPAYNSVKVDVRFLQVNEIGIDRRPIIDVADATESGWSYKSKNGAYLSLFLHCLCNLHLRHKDHWSIDYLKVSKELLLVLPITPEKDTGAVVGVFYRNTTDDRIHIRQIGDKCEILPPMVIAVDYNQVFVKRRDQLLI